MRVLVYIEYGTYYIYKETSPNNLELIDSFEKTYNQYPDVTDGITSNFIFSKQKTVRRSGLVSYILNPLNF